MVHFVGAGPGAEDLITLRGARYIETADTIIYAGSLVNPALLSRAKSGCEIFNSAEMTLEEVIAVMTAPQRAGAELVRLHTGDSSIYGAVREQMELLDAAGVEYDVCPGVSSFCGAAASLRAEYTLPGISQTVILTRMEGRTPVPEAEEISTLAAHGATMVIFLSTGMLGELSRRLILGGYTENTPAAIVYKATWPDEKIVRTTVSELHAAAEAAGVKNTALILVGGFLGGCYKRSRLYDPGFSTQLRQGTDSQ
jgi:precorrin-4/cobalt-precorrin-4 C11-methyltransferase